MASMDDDGGHRPEPDAAQATEKADAVTLSGRPRIVAVGASAGGLEPIERFFQHIPGDTGFAFVVVQHLSPDFRSMMPELLARRSSLSIRKIDDRMEIEPNTIYLNPPRASISIEDGRFRLTQHNSPTEPNLPINDFLIALANSAGAEAIAVVLSGTGSDGTIGAQRIAQAGGTVLAQDPVTAKFDGMPRSVIEAAPNVLYERPEKLPELVLSAARGGDLSQYRSRAAPERPRGTPEQEIIRHLQIRYGIDFGYYKTSTVARRIERRVAMSRARNIEEYASALQDDLEELEVLYTDLLIGVTSFFRDPAAYEELGRRVNAKLVAGMAEGREARIWIPGCASGEEAYSIAMMLSEAARLQGVPPRIKIFATDIHPRSLRVAALGHFRAVALEKVSEELKDRYFTEVEDGFRVNKALRESIVFSKHNLIKDPPFTKVDLVTCRNLLIYFNDEAQKKVVAMFHFALKKGGILFLGPSEALNKFETEFKVLNSKWRIFEKLSDIRLTEATKLLPVTSAAIAGHTSGQVETEGPKNAEALRNNVVRRHALMRLYDAVLEEVVGTSLLVDEAGQLLHVFGDANRFLTVPAGGFSHQLGSFAPRPLRSIFAAGLDQLRRSPDHTFRSIAHMEDYQGSKVAIEVRMKRVAHEAEPDQAAIFIALTPVEAKDEREIVMEAGDETRSGHLASLSDEFLQKRVGELERDLHFSEETLQTTIEELETSNEELQASNEELQATNEELMAANEELQTVNEELHAVNEELYTVSTEHQIKITELTNATDDLEVLLRCTDIGVVFLDADLNIRLVTPAVSRTFNILERDVGRPISHVTTRFDFPEMTSAIERVVSDNRPIEKAIGVDSRDYSLRILPYERAGSPDGVVMTFIDITEIARANRSLAQFADVVSHDLKAPLRAIRTASDWIVEALGENASGEVQENVKLLHEQTDRLSRMLTSLKDFSSQNPVDLPKVGTDLDELVRDIAQIYSADQLRFENLTPGETLTTQKAALRLVLQNLMENAVRHTDSPPVSVTFKAEGGGGMWRFTVSDDGPGIDPRHHEKIFLPFRRLRSEGSTSGSGIGLALVQKTVREMGGVIEVRSDPAVERGTSFSFSWPGA